MFFWAFPPEYLVQYDDDDWLPFKWRNLSTYPGNLNSVILQLSPFIIYEFRVIAINDIGMSKPSRSSANFQTGGAREYFMLDEFDNVI